MHDDRLVGDGFISVHDISVLLGYILDGQQRAALHRHHRPQEPSTRLLGPLLPKLHAERDESGVPQAAHQLRRHKYVTATPTPIKACVRPIDDDGSTTAAVLAPRGDEPRPRPARHDEPQLPGALRNVAIPLPTAHRGHGLPCVPPLLDDEYNMRICESDAGAVDLLSALYRAALGDRAAQHVAYERGVIYEFVASSVRPACMHAPSENQDRIVVKCVRHHGMRRT